MEYRVLQECPVNSQIAPYFALLANEAKAVINSIDRGTSSEATKLLHKYGKHTQAECIELYARGVPGFGPANPVDETTHCLRNDGVAYKNLPPKAHLEFWQQGIDIDDQFIDAMIRASVHHGWRLYQPYSSGAEFHHLNFVYRPLPKGLDRARIIYWRGKLPKS